MQQASGTASLIQKFCTQRCEVVSGVRHMNAVNLHQARLVLG